MGIFKSIFTWWDGPTIGTRLWSRANGEEVGRDDAGNIYYSKAAKNGQRERRWVIYSGENEASRIPSEWHGWLHRTHDAPIPAEARRAWVKPHQPNLTGSPQAYIRPGGMPGSGQRPRTTGDYEAWSPGDDPVRGDPA
ncbi:NADH:ubiquinone oxidoreductase subunit NDUFA12 [Pacificimonas sp. WHA3]|uniref:NADH:ubiquinone oxidoreductase subunit NDUFA12 n=1 Tax=Pacificimonas pallii TaxID=2827236 RepID=A0ABS6SGK5_9SPHN|nr:NADH:ubiquinone oxidoreductase subunit NDUFA12 [Pacificimonas pallii]MBV7257544.1 NADH:ubiquinone oxidoreductase subunit NDUFA12 [Pacificimonas pallii]